MARRRTFTDWLDCQRHGDDPVADLAEDARHDPRVRGAATARAFLAAAQGLPPWAVAAVHEAATRRRAGRQVLRDLQERAVRTIDRHDLVFGPPAENPLDVLNSPKVPTSAGITRKVRRETLRAAETDMTRNDHPQEHA